MAWGPLFLPQCKYTRELKLSLVNNDRYCNLPSLSSLYFFFVSVFIFRVFFIFELPSFLWSSSFFWPSSILGCLYFWGHLSFWGHFLLWCCLSLLSLLAGLSSFFLAIFIFGVVFIFRITFIVEVPVWHNSAQPSIICLIFMLIHLNGGVSLSRNICTNSLKLTAYCDFQRSHNNVNLSTNQRPWFFLTHIM